MNRMTRRTFVGRCAALALPLAGGCAPPRDGYFRFMTSWTAEPEHGGFYQAAATGLYSAAGLEVDLRAGGAQINPLQMLLADRVDAILGFDIQTLLGIANQLPIVTVAACLQSDLQGVMTHPDVASLSDLKDRTILVNATGNASWWPWLRTRYGLRDDQTRPYSDNLQPFFAAPRIATGGYLTSEPFRAEMAHVPVNFFRFGDLGYPPYGATIVTTRSVIRRRPHELRQFVRASLEGWRDYLADPSAGNAMIRRLSPQVSAAQMTYAVGRIKAAQLVDGGDAKRFGIGTMSAERWEATADMLAATGLTRGEVPWQEAFTTLFVADLRIGAAASNKVAPRDRAALKDGGASA